MRAFLALLLFAIGCGKNEGSDRRAPEGPEAAAVEQAPKASHPLEGPLTVERMVAAKNGVRPYDEWGKAWAHLIATAGEPTESAGDTFGWTLLVGETCHVLEVRRDAGEDRVDGVMYGPYEPGTSQHQRCAGSR